MLNNSFLGKTQNKIKSHILSKHNYNDVKYKNGKRLREYGDKNDYADGAFYILNGSDAANMYDYAMYAYNYLLEYVYETDWRITKGYPAFVSTNQSALYGRYRYLKELHSTSILELTNNPNLDQRKKILGEAILVIDLPNCEFIDFASAYYLGSNIKLLNLPKCKSIMAYNFDLGTPLVNLTCNFLLLEEIQVWCFENLYNCKFYLPKIKILRSNNFNAQTKSEIYLGAIPPELFDVSMVFSNYTVIKVPKGSLDTYMKADDWVVAKEINGFTIEEYDLSEVPL